MKSEFITDVEQQYEVYCKIAEEYGFIDFNAKKSGFRCTTKSNEFNAGWIAFTGAIAAMREDQQSKVDELQAKLEQAYEDIETFDTAHQRECEFKAQFAKERDELQKRVDAALKMISINRGFALGNVSISHLEQALKGESNG